MTRRNETLLFLHMTLGLWLGVHAFRTYVPVSVWNLADALPLQLKSSVAVSVQLAGILLGAQRFMARRKPLQVVIVALALLGVVRQVFLGHELIGSITSLGAWILWLGWLGSCALRGRMRVLGAAAASALMLQVALQAATHGLDLPLARGLVPILCAVAINALFVLSAVHDDDVQPVNTNAYLAFGAFTFLEFTLFANLGRVGFTGGLGHVPTALLIQLGLIAGLLLARRPQPVLVYIARILLIATVINAAGFGRGGVVLLVIGQAALVASFASACAAPSRLGARSGFVIGQLISFALVFFFYAKYELPALWVLAALAVVLLGVQKTAVEQPVRPLVAVCITALLITAFGFIGSKPVTQHGTPGALRVVSYNIHQGFDSYGMPAMQQIADELRAMNGDVIALQEVGRGWDFVGGADIVGYLQYRFPEYQLHYQPVNGRLWGVALLSRLPVDDVRGAAFVTDPGIFRYGYMQAGVQFENRTIEVTSVHLTAGLEGDGESGRTRQTEQLLQSVASTGDAIVAGDFNAFPTDRPVLRMKEAGYADAGALLGQGEIGTWPAHAADQHLDYVWTRGRLRPVKGFVGNSTASDHKPVVVDLLVD